ncbi:MAG: 1-acyl-sn-glycerol-3-phosphate acyltransferase [Lentimicrobiaceae bacterium]|jgi:1-acyl-sn-glycerol-3-phosphate acyltransferase
MKQKIAKSILRLFGWKIIINLPPDAKKFVVMMAPHTSNWDFPIGWLGYMSIGVDARYLIKKEAFFFPLGEILKSIGAIPVDRKASTNIVIQVGEMFKKHDSLFITIAPEGTRSLNPNWKRGFYYIAQHAQVPIAFGFLDYPNKVGGIGGMLFPTGDYEADLKIIEAFYSQQGARHPEKFNLSPQNRK